MNDDFQSFVESDVVLDTAETVVYLGRLTAVTDTGFILENADVHDVGDGHATKEVYIIEAARNGVSPNRKRVFVMRASVMSVSRLDDIVDE